MAESYSFQNIVLLVSGVPITGFFEGDDVIQASRNVDSASHIVGADGKMAIALNADKSGTLIFRLQQTSSSNAYMSGLINAIESSLLGVVVEVHMNDIVRGDTVRGSQGYILRPADLNRGQGITPQQWQIVVENLDVFLELAS